VHRPSLGHESSLVGALTAGSGGVERHRAVGGWLAEAVGLASYYT
jgi:hypothetical protein